MKEMRACNICGSVHPVLGMTEFDDTYLCDICLQTDTTCCQRCGERIWMDANAGDDNTPLCQSFYNRDYTTREDCGRVIHQDDTYYIDKDDNETRLHSCHCRHADRRVIHDYYYKPHPEFRGQGSR